MTAISKTGSPGVVIAHPDMLAMSVGAHIKTLHTLGPEGTNCEQAARTWAQQRNCACTISLYPTLEEAASAAAADATGALLSPIAYPNLHTIIYAYINTLEIIDLFLTQTDEMVLASATPTATPKTCSTHPAPQILIPQHVERRFVASNAQAAHDCHCGLSDCCLTTATLVDKLGLHRLQSFGKIPMGFSIHCRTKG